MTIPCLTIIKKSVSAPKSLLKLWFLTSRGEKGRNGERRLQKYQLKQSQKKQECC